MTRGHVSLTPAGGDIEESPQSRFDEDALRALQERPWRPPPGRDRGRLGFPLAPLGAQRVARGLPLLRAHYAYAPSDKHREGLAAFIAKRPARFNP